MSSKYFNIIIQNNKDILEHCLSILKKELDEKKDPTLIILENKKYKIEYNNHLLMIHIPNKKGGLNFFWYDYGDLFKEESIDSQLPEKINIVKLKKGLGVIYIFNRDYSEEINIEFEEEDFNSKSKKINRFRNYYSFEANSYSSNENKLIEGCNLLSTINKINNIIGLEIYKIEMQDFLYLKKELSQETKDVLKLTADVDQQDYLLSDKYNINLNELKTIYKPKKKRKNN